MDTTAVIAYILISYLLSAECHARRYVKNKKGEKMNWKKIIIYIGILFLATMLVAFPFGFIQGLFGITEGNALLLINLCQAIAVLAASIWVFAHLTLKLQEKIFLHALCVGVGSWLLSFPINVLVFGQAILFWGLGIVIIIFTLSIGILIGAIIKKKKPITSHSR